MIEHDILVTELVKDPAEILKTLTADKVDLIHSILGIGDEFGELCSAIKKHTIYNQDLDITNVNEELGDLRFYMKQMMLRLGLTDVGVLGGNIQKLRKRYPKGYTDKHAKERLDKKLVKVPSLT